MLLVTGNFHVRSPSWWSDHIDTIKSAWHELIWIQNSKIQKTLTMDSIRS